MQILIKLFGEDMAPKLYGIFYTLGFMDMYHSRWFTLFLVLFSANIIICSIERLPHLWKVVKKPLTPIKEDAFQKFSNKQEITLKGNLKTIQEKMAEVLRAYRYKPAEIQKEDHVQFYGQKGTYSRLGVYAVHFSVIIIFIGALMGNYFGFNGYLNLPEGASSKFYYNNGKEAPLGFTIQCRDFDIEYYENFEMPKSYKSDLSIIKDGVELKRKTIQVNDPLTYKGVTFYQSSYGMIPKAQGRFILKVLSKEGEEEIFELKKGGEFFIPGTSLKGKIENFSPALWFDKEKGFFTYAKEMVNPAVYVTFSEDEQIKFGGWIWKREPKTGILPEVGHQIVFVDYAGVQYTGLQVRKDPGVSLVYLGCAFMTIGLWMAFFMSHRKIWAQLKAKKNSVSLIFGGTTNKNRLAFVRELEKIRDRVRKEMER